MFDERESALAPREPLRADFATVLDDLWRQKHTGPITVHFAEGVAQQVDYPQEPMRIKLDRRAKNAHD